MDPVGYCFQQVFEELPRCPSISVVDEWVSANFLGAVDADEQMQFASGSLHLSNINVEETDRVALEALPLRLVAFDVGQTGDAVTLQTSVQR